MKQKIWVYRAPGDGLFFRSCKAGKKDYYELLGITELDITPEKKEVAKTVDADVDVDINDKFQDVASASIPKGAYDVFVGYKIKE